MTIDIPDPSLVLLIGLSGAGKTTFARRHFRPTEILSSDAFRALVADDEADQDASSDAFQALRFVAARRLKRKRLTVIDATNIRAGSRKPFIGLAHVRAVPAVAIVFDLPESVLQERNRLHRRLAPEVVARQAADLQASLGSLAQEGMASVHILDSEEAVAKAVVDRRADILVLTP
jgi:protein phosphatase